MRRFVPRYEVVFSGGVFYGAEQILRSDITVFQGGGNRQRTLLLSESPSVRLRFLQVLHRQNSRGKKRQAG